MATWCKDLTHWKRIWCWERLKAGREGGYRGWDGCTASLTQWTWVWASFRSWWWTGKPGVLQSMGLQSWTRLSNWTENIHKGFPGGSVVKNLPVNSGDMSSVSGSKRSPGEENDNPLWYLCLGSPWVISVQSSPSVVSDSLWPHELQYARLPCPSPTPEACSNSCPSNWWCHPTISSSVIPSSNENPMNSMGHFIFEKNKKKTIQQRKEDAFSVFSWDSWISSTEK